MSKKIYLSIPLLFMFAVSLWGTEPFSIVLLPDTQYYSKSYPATYKAQTNWIVNHRNTENIKMAVHLGDITHTNTAGEWNNAKTAHQVLDLAGLPYSMVPGNHDNPDSGHKRDTTRYNNYFGPSVFNSKSWYGGHYGTTNDSNYSFFSSGSLRFMVLCLEFAPRKDVITWANNIIAAHPNHRVIIVTHCYQTGGGGHETECACGYDLTGGNGDSLFSELVQRHSNVFLVVSGHVGDSELESRAGLSGNTIYEVLTDYQKEPNGGNGWLRLVTFYPDTNRINFRSISVTGKTAFSCANYSADPDHPDHNFSVYYNMSTMAPYSRSNPLEDFTDRTVNQDGSGQQKNSVVAVNQHGNSVVVWEDDKDGNGVYQIMARGFNAKGEQNFSDITVNSIAAGQQYNPVVAIAENGRFYVAWQDDQDRDGKYQIYVSGFNSNGTKLFSDRQVNSSSSGQHINPAVACDYNGNFAVTWQDDSDGNGWYQILIRGFYASGSQRFAYKTVNSVSDGQQLNPDIGMDASGNFVVVWEDDKDKNGWYQIMARGFYASGSSRISDFTVNSVSNGQQYKPAVALDYPGNFVVVWEDDKDKNGKYQIMARGFYASGSSRISDFTVNSVSDGQQYKPAIGMDHSGNFVIAWQDDKDGNGVYQIMARGFTPGGSQAFGDKTINTCSSGQQYNPSVDLSEAGIFLSTWQDDKDGNGYYEILLNGKLF